jgi:cell wall-associated NlpC family hydrolase
MLSACGTKKGLQAGKQAELKKRGISFEHDDQSEEAAVKAIPDDLPVYGYSIRNKELYLFIKDWEGTPYRYGGNTQAGVDCSGFVCQAYTLVYKTPFLYRRARDIYKEVEPVDKIDLREGDLVFFKIKGRKIDHVGIYLNNGKFVHTSSSRGVMVSSLDEAYFAKRFFKGGRKES